MKERGILFSAPMVLALLAGRKTQTRRVVKPQPEATYSRAEVWGVHDGRSCARFTAPGKWVDGGDLTMGLACPFGQPGDRLWVRETWGGTERTISGREPWGLAYRATDKMLPNMGNWRPSIFMPRWASRITLEVTAVRVERLQEISEADAKAEGIEQSGTAPFPFAWPGAASVWPSARGAYLEGWDWLNGEGAAAKNPWVWVVEFKRIESAREAA